jgi:hypothetical protein
MRKTKSSRAAKAAPGLAVAFNQHMIIDRAFNAAPDVADIERRLLDTWPALLSAPIRTRKDETAAIKLCVLHGHVDPNTALHMLRRVLRYRLRAV